MTKHDDAVYEFLEARTDSDGLCSVPLALIATNLRIHLNTARAAVRNLADTGRLEIVHDSAGGPNYYSISPPLTVENPPGAGLYLVDPLQDPLQENVGPPTKPQVRPLPRENLTPSVDSKPPRGFESTEGQVSVSLGQSENNGAHPPEWHPSPEARAEATEAGYAIIAAIRADLQAAARRNRHRHWHRMATTDVAPTCQATRPTQ